MKHILLCTDGSIFAQSSYRYAGWLAPRLNAKIDVLSVSDIRSQKVASTGDYSGAIGIDASRELLNKLVELEHEKAKISHQKARLVLQEAEQLLKNEGVEAIDLIHETGFLVDIFHKFEADTDLIILGKRGEAAEFASGHLGANVERIVRASTKPCLVTSRNYKPIDRLLLAYDGSKSGQKMLEFITTSPAFKGLEVHVLTVGKKDEDDTAIANLKAADAQLQTAGFKPICQMIPGNPESVIAEHAEAHDISLLVMGAYGHSRIRHLVIGSTTVQVLRSSHIPVLLFR